jgi:hypothetical protein
MAACSVFQVLKELSALILQLFGFTDKKNYLGMLPSHLTFHSCSGQPADLSPTFFPNRQGERIYVFSRKVLEI